MYICLTNISVYQKLWRHSPKYQCIFGLDLDLRSLNKHWYFGLWCHKPQYTLLLTSQPQINTDIGKKKIIIVEPARYIRNCIMTIRKETWNTRCIIVQKKPSKTIIFHCYVLKKVLVNLLWIDLIFHHSIIHCCANFPIYHLPYFLISLICNCYCLDFRLWETIEICY